jgi:hypothetical protein
MHTSAFMLLHPCRADGAGVQILWLITIRPFGVKHFLAEQQWASLGCEHLWLTSIWQGLVCVTQ